MTSDDFLTTTDDCPRLTAALHLGADEHIRVGNIRSGYRAYWTLTRSGYSPTHGGATTNLLHLPVRDDEGKVVTAPTVVALCERIEALHATSDLAVPMFPERA